MSVVETYLSVVVPVFNEEVNVASLLDRLTRACELKTQDYEILVCDDGSTDGTVALVLERRRSDPRIKLLRLSRNFGHHAAAQAGMDHASGRWLFCLDGDLQDPPELLEALFAKAREGFDVINARKRSRPDRGLRGLGFRLFHQLLYHMSSEVRMEPNYGFFALLRREAYLSLRGLPERRKFLVGMRQWIGYRQAVVDFDRPAREGGETKQSLRRLVNLALDALFAFSSRPIRLIWILGLVGVTVSLLVTIYTLYHHFISHRAIVGWSSVMTAILFMGSVQLICASIIGEYIWRIYSEVQRRPPYVLRPEPDDADVGEAP